MSPALTDLLPHTIVQAPMGGGVAVPRLAAAVSEAGGLGFLAAGYKTADGLCQEIKRLRGLPGLPLGINLVMPQAQAPMAGGDAVPRLAAAVTEAGGLGFLAAGYKTADGMYQEIKQLRGLTGLPFGINLFMPQPETADPAAVDVYVHQLAGAASWYETELGDPDSGRDDGYDAKLAV